MHLSELLKRRYEPLEDLLEPQGDEVKKPEPPRELVIDCITNFQRIRTQSEMPLGPGSPLSSPISPTSPLSQQLWSPTSAVRPAVRKMHDQTRRRHFGSDMEM